MQPCINNYLEHLRVGKRLASATVDLYAQQLQHLETLSDAQDLHLTQVQSTHVRRWIAAHSSGLGAKTLALKLSSWRGFYKWLVANGAIAHNPCIDIKPPKVAKPLPKALGVDAAMALAEYKNTSPRDALIVELLYGCGLRVSELVGLDVAASSEGMKEGRGWIDEQAAEVHVFGKGSKRRMVPLGEKAKLALQNYLPARKQVLISLPKHDAPEAALLLGFKGNRLTRHAIWDLLRKRSLAAGLDQAVHPHMLRHSFASHVLQSSGDLRAVQELLGHSSIASTQVYTRLDFQHLAKIYDNSHPRAKHKTTPLKEHE
jgi:integrase/recombinase XerC